MTPFSPEHFITALALLGSVIVISALLSGLVERSGVPQVAVFLLLGAMIGPHGLGLLNISTDSAMFRVIATLSLALVLFTDAVSLNLTEVRRHWSLAAIVLGPGTLATAALVAVAAWWLLGLSPALAAILGAALASTDPVLLRGLLRHGNLSLPVKQALRLESGLNDAVLLPVVLLAMAFAGTAPMGEHAGLGTVLLKMFVISPAAGVVVSLFAITALDFFRKRIGVRRDYESIYSLGICFGAFAAAEGVHGSGFIAAFVAGVVIAALDVELCDCFVEYGETTAEMALMLAFVLFGTSIIWQGLGLVAAVTLIFTIAVILLRPVSFLPALAFTGLRWRERSLIAWFGPRGLSSLLLVLLPVFAGLDGSHYLLQITCLVVLVSVLLHGFSPRLLLGKTASISEPAALHPHQPKPAESAAVSPIAQLSSPEFLTLDEYDRLVRDGVPVHVVDARSDASYDFTDQVIPSSTRISPSDVRGGAAQLTLPRDTVLPVLCA